jgi:hypothetical protein
MTMKLVSSIALVIGAGSMLAACNIQQPTAGCIVQDSASWIATYTKKEGQPTCAKPAPVGELVGVFKFSDPEKENSNLLTLRPAGLASRGARDPGDTTLQTASGALPSEPDSEFFCTAAAMSDASVTAASSSTEDATQITYKFSKVQVYSNPRAPGTQMKADLAYTRDGCTAEYQMNAMWPAIACDPADTDPAHNCGPGSFINPDFKVKCHETLKICVLDGEVPAFKEEQK